MEKARVAEQQQTKDDGSLLMLLMLLSYSENGLQYEIKDVTILRAFYISRQICLLCVSFGADKWNAIMCTY